MIRVMQYNYRGELVSKDWPDAITASHEDRAGVSYLHVRDATDRVIGLVESTDVVDWQNPDSTPVARAHG